MTHAPDRLAALPSESNPAADGVLPMTTTDLDAPIRAIDILRIALNLPTTAERKARIEREIASVKMQANDFGVIVTFADGRRVLLTESFFED